MAESSRLAPASSLNPRQKIEAIHCRKLKASSSKLLNPWTEDQGCNPWSRTHEILCLLALVAASCNWLGGRISVLELLSLLPRVDSSKRSQGPIGSLIALAEKSLNSSSSSSSSGDSFMGSRAAADIGKQSKPLIGSPIVMAEKSLNSSSSSSSSGHFFMGSWAAAAPRHDDDSWFTSGSIGVRTISLAEILDDSTW